ncbi:hypothetical protein SEA_LILPHARAOH_43 [Mycobacterium phage LilPharaoh]|uniref:Uncharacterized protein n=1 Tax=Mycobacterium phage Amelie TaxID=1913035 RepID=A0A1J0GQA8_9CAUD|nr:hypothetical protein AVV01_gp45 [Mycobacterium phage Enkosi]YP_009952561.1 hypothetical protein I5G92_gp43 [Mycobacterium phage Amelie]ATN90496.1 hypothetical protein SEA_LILPHARAOH_43 [Mycobacterium phage LilPharaoh]AVP42620.1 hypothetical protein SEA_SGTBEANSPROUT_43 [Mycobacterium phage SgtBeansprout]AXC37149.1 membrane protein [Mycobacterium phage Biglebops]QGJ93328.1 membrane protein [Mycobacterium phage Mdavu]UQS94443.1 membrane protein [Mycobacterium phage Nutello]UXE03206.1 membra
MTPAPYCLPCNRHHVGDCPPGERLAALVGVVLLNVAMTIVGLAAAALWLGLDLGVLPW